MFIAPGDPIPLVCYVDTFDPDLNVYGIIFNNSFQSFDPPMFAFMAWDPVLNIYSNFSLIMPETDEELVIVYQVANTGFETISFASETLSNPPEGSGLPPGPTTIYSEEITAIIEDQYLIATIDN